MTTEETSINKKKNKKKSKRILLNKDEDSSSEEHEHTIYNIDQLHITNIKYNRRNKKSKEINNLKKRKRMESGAAIQCEEDEDQDMDEEHDDSSEDITLSNDADDECESDWPSGMTSSDRFISGRINSKRRAVTVIHPNKSVEETSRKRLKKKL